MRKIPSKLGGKSKDISAHQKDSEVTNNTQCEDITTQGKTRDLVE